LYLIINYYDDDDDDDDDYAVGQIKNFKKSPFFLNLRKFVPQFFCMLAHRSCVPSYVRIREKLQE